jgi:multicomponent Na+:H+ antiporter subunit D
MYSSALPFYAGMVSLIAMPLILLSSRHATLREFWTLAASIVKFSLVFLLLPGALAGRIAGFTFWEISPGIALALKADQFGVFFALIASGLWILTSIYSIGYVRGLKEHKQTRYFASFAVCLSATIGIAFAANLLTFVFFYEILTIATYPLVIHKETKVAVAAGRKYLVYTLTAGVLLIAATAWTYRIAGTLDFRAGGLFGDASFSPAAITALFLLFLGGVGVKAAVMPLHSWLPAAMAAPTPVSALLHAVAVVKSGVFGVVRVVGFVFGPSLMRQFDLNIFLATVAGATIILASLLAFRQDNLKHRLAYSTVGHLSYIVLGGGPDFSRVARRRSAAYRQPCHDEDHAVFLRRRHIRQAPQGKDQRTGRHRQGHALDHGRLHFGLHWSGGHSAHQRIHQQVAARSGFPAGR